MMIKNKQKSFTLIELLVVIVIIGILASVIMISTSSSIEKANFAKTRAFSKTVHDSLLLNLVSEWGARNISQSGASWTLIDEWGNNNGTFKDGASSICSSVSGSEACPQIVNNEIFGKALSFNGVDNYITFGNALAPSKINNRTYTFWVYLNSFDVTVFSSGNLSYSKNGYSLFRPINNSAIQFSYELNESPYTFNFDCPMELNKWMFFTVYIKLDHPNINFSLYKNGTLQDFESRILGVGEQYNVPFKLGAHTSGYPTPTEMHFFNGLIGEFKVYNEIIAQSQIRKEYLSGLNNLFQEKLILKEEYNQMMRI